MLTINEIVSQLKKWDDAYYNGQSVVDDSVYDKLRDYLKSIDPDNCYFNTVGFAVPSHREEVDLIIHMGSQLKVNTEKEACDWFNKYGGQEVVVSDKLDGSSMEVVYRDGKLWRIATRGSGKRGMAITKNGRLWSGLPHTINVKGECVVRGEAQMSVTVYNNHFSGMANPRNAGNGITVSDSDYERNKYLSFHAFDIVHPDIEFKKQSHKFKTLESLGINTVRWFRCRTWEDLVKCRSHYEADRSKLDFEIDGMIVALEDLEVQKDAGYADGGTRPRGMRAWKFSAEKANTEVVSIDLTLGHTGRVIPTATLKAVKLAGTTVTHCLLNNFQYVEQLDLNVGDIVEVEKAGDIIPHINRVVKKNSSGPFLPPNEWKGYPLVKEGRDWKVVDEDCPDLNFQRIRNWVNKTGIKQLGDNALMSMIDNGLVKDINDLYSLNENEVALLPVGKGKIGNNAKKILKEIDKTREMPIDLFIGSLSIKHLGRSRAALLVDHGFDNIDYYLNVDTSNFVGMPCSDTGKYGQETANEIYESLNKRRDLILRLRDHVKILQPNKKVTDGRLSGKSFCFSGVRMKPDQKEKFDNAGGEEKKGVSKGLDYLVLKDPASTSSKAEKARKLGIAIISIDDLESMISDE